MITPNQAEHCASLIHNIRAILSAIRYNDLDAEERGKRGYQKPLSIAWSTASRARPSGTSDPDEALEWLYGIPNTSPALKAAITALTAWASNPDPSPDNIATLAQAEKVIRGLATPHRAVASTDPPSSAAQPAPQEAPNVEAPLPADPLELFKRPEFPKGDDALPTGARFIVLRLYKNPKLKVKKADAALWIFHAANGRKPGSKPGGAQREKASDILLELEAIRVLERVASSGSAKAHKKWMLRNIAPK